MQKASKVHNNKYDYSRSIYFNATNKVEIVCPVHGTFWQLPRKHLRGQGCKLCSNASANNYKKTSVLEFVLRANAIHNSKYDYTLVQFKALTAKIRIRCPVHGEFIQQAMSHLRGSGCPACRDVGTLSRRLRDNQRNHDFSTAWFIDMARKKHGNEYDYNLVNYIKSTEQVVIICRDHGQFRQIARDHLIGRGCPKCGLEKLHISNTKGLSTFVDEASRLHLGRYQYTNVLYVNQDTPVSIICPDHGCFSQNPRHHLRGHGCPLCAVSSGHLAIVSYIRSLMPDINIYHNRRDIIPPLELDIVLPEFKLAIEYHGSYWHSLGRDSKPCDQWRHSKKVIASEEKGWRLIQILEHEWLHKQAIIKSMLRHYIGLSMPKNARDLTARSLSWQEASMFLNSNHIAGSKPASVHIGLVDKDIIYACMSISKHPRYQYEIARFAVLAGYNVRGAASKMFSFFNLHYHPKSVFTYADRRFSIGGVYEKLGFVKAGITKPNYCYVRGSEHYSRQYFQKQHQASRLKVFDPALSESENMYRNGYRRLYDAGHLRFLWQAEQ